MAPVLVIGETHLDIIAKFAPGEHNRKDKIGNVRYWVGGTAFNIAANLVTHDVGVCLLTCLPDSSLGSRTIRSVLADSGIDTRYVFSSEAIGDSAYVAHYKDSELFSSVTSSGIDNVVLNALNLQKAVRRADFTVIDTNLSTGQIKQVVEACRLANKPLFATIASAEKADRILEKEFTTKFEAVSMDIEEAETLGYNDGFSLTQTRAFLEKLNTQLAFVAKDKKGYCVLDANGVQDHAEDMLGITNVLGARDAFVSAICFAWIQGKRYDSALTETYIRAWVNQVLLNGGSPNMLDTSISPRPPKSWLQQATVLLSGFLLLICAIAFLLRGTFVPSISPIDFWTCFFVCALSLGAIGGLIREMGVIVLEGSGQTAARDYYKPIFEAAFFGMVAGVVSALVFAVPHLTVGDRAKALRSQVDDFNLLIIWVVPVALGAGLAFEFVLRSARKNAPLLPKRGKESEGSPEAESGD